MIHDVPADQGAHQGEQVVVLRTNLRIHPQVFPRFVSAQAVTIGRLDPDANPILFRVTEITEVRG